MHSECLAAIAFTVYSVQACLTQEFNIKEYITYDFLFGMNRVLSATLRIHKFNIILSLSSLNVCKPRVLLTSVSLSVVKGIWCSETDAGHHLKKLWIWDIQHLVNIFDSSKFFI